MNSTIPSILSKEDAKKLTRKNLIEDTFYVTKSDDEGRKYAKVKVEDDQISFEDWKDEVQEERSFCVDFLDFINSRTSVIDIHTFIMEFNFDQHKKELHNPKLPKDKIKFSKIEVNGREVYFGSFKTSEQNDFVFKFGSLLKTLGCFSVLPAEAFLKIENSSVGEVVIATDGGSPRALNFLLLASGIMDESYQGTKFDDQNSFVNGGYYNNPWHYFEGVVDGIQNEKIYERKIFKRGDVEGGDAVHPNSLSFFSVWKKNSSIPSASTFGRVKRGMEFFDNLQHEEDLVKECGLLLDLH